MKAAAILFLLSLSCAAYGAPKQHGRFFISGQPTPQELKQFKKKTGAAVLDLRSIDELGNCSEPATVTSLGMQYGRVNFEKAAQIDPEVIASIDRLVDGTHDKPVFLFCKTGSRAAAWLAIHMVKKEKVPLEKAISIAREMGLKPAMEQATRQFLKH
jgi:protein tyrosine phosphatase (PTP) superfamily phosphohydrolase (DUF442 family)